VRKLFCLFLVGCSAPETSSPKSLPASIPVSIPLPVSRPTEEHTFCRQARFQNKTLCELKSDLAQTLCWSDERLNARIKEITEVGPVDEIVSSCLKLEANLRNSIVKVKALDEIKIK
jgi:hypothetical protein